jgi:hypothetical protein
MFAAGSVRNKISIKGGKAPVFFKLTPLLELYSNYSILMFPVFLKRE